MLKKPDEEVFRENLFNKKNINQLAVSMEAKLRGSNKALVNKIIDTNPWMIKLIDFYQEEMGSDSGMSKDSRSSLSS